MELFAKLVQFIVAPPGVVITTNKNRQGDFDNPLLRNNIFKGTRVLKGTREDFECIKKKIKRWQVFMNTKVLFPPGKKRIEKDLVLGFNVDLGVLGLREISYVNITTLKEKENSLFVVASTRHQSLVDGYYIFKVKFKNCKIKIEYSKIQTPGNNILRILFGNRFFTDNRESVQNTLDILEECVDC